MKVALLHYWLTNIRGGEKVFLELCEMFPDADIFTHVISPEIKHKYFSGRRVHTSSINKLPYAEKLYKSYMPLMFSAARAFDFSDYDLIISSESGPIKGIRKPKRAKHVCYCHSPMRYIWDMFDIYYKNAPLHKKGAMKLLKNYLQTQDLRSAESVDIFIANSFFVKERISRIYNRDAQVIHPPVNTAFFMQDKNNSQADYYLLAGQLVHYKRPDIAIKAFKQNGKKLIVAGIGEELDYLKKLAGPNIIFKGRVSDETLRNLYANAQALIFPGVEDFGIIPIEAQASGTPVIAYAEGGALETVLDGETGVFFKEQTPESLNAAVNQFEEQRDTFNPQTIRSNSLRFSPEIFRKSLSQILPI
jgi:glycosyltransferase involved in cell wall biosynthesis